MPLMLSARLGLLKRRGTYEAWTWLGVHQHSHLDRKKYALRIISRHWEKERVPLEDRMIKVMMSWTLDIMY